MISLPYRVFNRAGFLILGASNRKRPNRLHAMYAVHSFWREPDSLCRRVVKEHVTVSELADAVDRSVSTVSRHIDALVQNGLVVKPRDEQAKRVTPTTTGRLVARNRLQGQATTD